MQIEPNLVKMLDLSGFFFWECHCKNIGLQKKVKAALHFFDILETIEISPNWVFYVGVFLVWLEVD